MRSESAFLFFYQTRKFEGEMTHWAHDVVATLNQRY